jgi:hypothetical protein
MEETAVDRLFKEFRDLVLFLKESDEISFSNTADENFRKALLMAAASYFEYRVKSALESFAKKGSKGDQRLVEFIKNKAITRQYHTYFDWESSNANSFFGLFGVVFRDFMKGEVEKNGDLDKAIKAFLEIGRDRNRLVHQDFGTFSIEKTAEEIYGLYKAAKIFVDTFQMNLEEGAPNTLMNDEET